MAFTLGTADFLYLLPLDEAEKPLAPRSGAELQAGPRASRLVPEGAERGRAPSPAFLMENLEGSWTGARGHWFAPYLKVRVGPGWLGQIPERLRKTDTEFPKTVLSAFDPMAPRVEGDPSRRLSPPCAFGLAGLGQNGVCTLTPALTTPPYMDSGESVMR